MSATDSLALLRIEFKLDLILSVLKARDPALMHMLDDIAPRALAVYCAGEDICPACSQPVRLHIDWKSETYIRACGCRPPIPIVPGISALTLPPTDPNPKPQPPAEEELHTDAEVDSGGRG